MGLAEPGKRMGCSKKLDLVPVCLRKSVSTRYLDFATAVPRSSRQRIRRKKTREMHFGFLPQVTRRYARILTMLPNTIICGMEER